MSLKADAIFTLMNSFAVSIVGLVKDKTVDEKVPSSYRDSLINTPSSTLLNLSTITKVHRVSVRSKYYKYLTCRKLNIRTVEAVLKHRQHQVPSYPSWPFPPLPSTVSPIASNADNNYLGAISTNLLTLSDHIYHHTGWRWQGPLASWLYLFHFNFEL